MTFDVIVVGTGLAGMSVALELSRTRRVALLSKRSLGDSASDWAQGGIAAALDSSDKVESHVDDTLVAGAGLCDEAATREIAGQGRAAINWLIEQGVPFTRDARAELGYHLTQEGGHSHRRIIHAADATGHAVIQTLGARARAQANISLLEHHHVIDLITATGSGLTGQRCQGLHALDVSSGRAVNLWAPHTVLATGGAGQVYRYTTNPDTATGDGIAMAWRAGCRVANMEFVQFHPTCLYHPDAQSFLISEAVRGEGGILVRPDGTRFMPCHDTRAELAPRDIVARAIDSEIKKHGVDCVYLNISHKPASFLHEHFPTILKRCSEFGIDITCQPIPVVPAAHYLCGGVVTDTAGRTDLAGLYVVGETGYTGLHGANRLASNSLLECVVIGRAAARAIAKSDFFATRVTPPGRVEHRVGDVDEKVTLARQCDELRRLMWSDAGILRTDKRLAHAQNRLRLLREEINEYYARFRMSPDLLELRNLVDVATLIVDSACMRRESRGLHFSCDWPAALPKALPTVLTRPTR